MYSQIKKNNYSQQSYMSLIYYYALQNIHVPDHIKKRFFIFIIISLEYLKPIAKNYIFQKIYAYAYDVKTVTNEIVQPGFFMNYKKEIKFKGQVNAKTCNVLYFYFQKYLKKQDITHDINVLI